MPERAGAGLQVLPSPASLGRPASEQATVTPPATLAIAPSANPAASAGPIAPHPLPRVHPEIFSSADPEVQAPVLVRPQLPDEPAPGSDTGYFDLVVDENGDVSHVKLTSPRRKYYDRMLVAAAKAWKFRPATLNGQPVKYRLRVPIIMTGMPGR
jgi:protein TonB